MVCPTCKGSGKVLYHFEGTRVGECRDCDGTGTLTRDQQHRYYGEAGYNDSEPDPVDEIRSEIYEDLRVED